MAANQDNFDSNNIGLGVDIVSIARIEKIINRTPNFIEYTFTDIEIKYCKSYSRRMEHFATHFAAKEAVLKALGTGFYNASPKDVEVVHDKRGKPNIVLYNKVKEYADKLEIVSIPVSLSFTKLDAVAVAIAMKNNSNLSALSGKKNSTVDKLAVQFKEAKQILENSPSAFDTE